MEELDEMSAFKLLVLELAKRGLATVDQLCRLTRDQWREIMRASSMPVSLARSAVVLSPRLRPRRHPLHPPRPWCTLSSTTEVWSGLFS
jgi:hypothetical protein